RNVTGVQTCALPILAFGRSPRGDLRDLPTVLGQQLPGRPSTWSTSVHLPAVPDGGAAGTERAGVVVLGHSYAWAGLRRDAEGIALVHGTMAEDGAHEETRVHRVLSTDPSAEAFV